MRECTRRLPCQDEHAAGLRSAHSRERLSPHGSWSERVKICKTFALALTRHIAAVDAGLMRFYGTLAFRFYLILSRGRTLSEAIA